MIGFKGLKKFKFPYVSLVILIVYISLLVIYYSTPETFSSEEIQFYNDNYGISESVLSNYIDYGSSRDYVLYSRLLMNGNGWLIPLMNNMGIFKFSHNDFNQHLPTAVVYLIIHPIIEIYLGHIVLIFTYFVLFFVGNVQSDRTSFTINSNNCTEDSKLSEPMSCCGSHYYSKAWGFVAAVWIYLSNNNVVKYFGVLYLLGMWAWQIYMDKRNAGMVKDSCFQLDWHASWVLQGFMFLGVLIIISNPNRRSTRVLQVMVAVVFVYYLILLFSIYKFMDEDFDVSLLVIPTVVLGAIFSWFLIFSGSKAKLDIYDVNTKFTI